MKSAFLIIALISAFAVIVPMSAEASIFGLIPNTMASEGSPSRRSGTWSYQSIGPLGNGYSYGDSENSESNNDDTAVSNNSPFGLISSYMGLEPLGHIPTLSDLFGD